MTDETALPAGETPAAIARREGRQRQAENMRAVKKARTEAGAMGRAARAASFDAHAENRFFSSKGNALMGLIGYGGKGTPVSYMQVVLILFIVLCLFDSKGALALASAASYTMLQRQKLAAKVIGREARTIKRIVEHFLTTGTLLVEDVSQRGAGSSVYSGFDRLNEAQMKEVDAHVKSSLGSGDPTFTTRRAVAAFIRRSFDLYLSTKRVGKLLHQLGYKWGKLKKRKHGNLSPARNQQRLMWVVQLSYYLTNNYTLLCFDESYANVRMCFTQGYGEEGKMDAEWGATNGGLGQRLCFVNVLARDGLLVVQDASGNVIELPDLGDVDAEKACADMMFGAKKGANSGDYHGNFDAALFIKYVKQRLIPALRHRYPGAFAAASDQKLCIMADNAPYHCKTTPNLDTKHPDKLRFSPDDLSRKELVECMAALGCTVLKVKINIYEGKKKDKKWVRFEYIDVAMDDAERDRKKSSMGKSASVPELAEAALEYICKHDGGRLQYVLFNDFEAAIREVAQDRQGKPSIVILWNPANYPCGNPIEMLWSRAKEYSKHLYKLGRTVRTLMEQVRDGMYTDKEADPSATGGKYVKDPVTGKCDSAEKLFQHMLFSAKPSGGAQPIIDHHKDVLKGTVEKLECVGEEGNDLKERALKYSCRSSMRWAITDYLLSKTALRGEEQLETELGELDDDHDEFA